MKSNLIKGKQFLLGIQLALAVGSTTIARNNGQTWINSLLIGAGTFSISSMITDGKEEGEQKTQKKPGKSTKGYCSMGETKRESIGKMTI